jgi:glycosyltransferase involved in cell wall biosynthesis
MADCSISIIIPAYNVDRYLEEALDSIKSQDELPDEVILIDDGSTDLTLEIAQSYQFSIPYHVISIDNNGQGHARNLGIRRASSKYLYFFDSDDCLTNNFIGSIKRLIERNQQPDILLFSGQSFRDTEYRGNLCFDYRRGFSGFLDDRVAFLDQAYSHNALFVSPCLYVSKRSLWGQNRLEFGKNFYEDDAIFYPLIFSCSSFAVIDEVFFLRRLREGSTMTTAPNTKHMNGALFRMRTAIDLYRSPNLSRRERC